MRIRFKTDLSMTPYSSVALFCCLCRCLLHTYYRGCPLAPQGEGRGEWLRPHRQTGVQGFS